MKVSIIGSGIVGQATGMGLAFNGNDVLFHDIDRNKLLTLNKEGFNVTDNISDAVSYADVIFVCVPTPTVAKKIELRFIQNCTRAIGKNLPKTPKYRVVAYRSTIPPQTSRTKLAPYLESYSGLTVGRDFGVCMNPEFLREKTPLDDFLNPSRIVIGELDKTSGDILQEVYAQFKCPLIRTDLDTAELIKYTSNVFLAAKISFFNEVYLVCRKLGLDPHVVGEAVALDPRIGGYGVMGGRPFGGMCLPKDLSAFLEFTKSMGLNLKLIEAVDAINEEMNLYCPVNPELKIRRKTS